MQGFLFDSNHLDAYFRQEPIMLSRLRGYPAEWLALTCATTLGEVEAGHRMTTTSDQRKRDEYDKFLNENFAPYALKVTVKTRTFYAEIMGRIWKNHPPSSGKTKTEKHLVEQGLDINDVWLVAAAWEHNITVATTDDMAWIREAVGDDVRFVNLLEPT